jgi:2-C-methyl-D-erythritol 4-phosphate cytidylyltransferase/2-C-methyl-D-erythritol 2,4-cyclodiphosphate synthase
MHVVAIIAAGGRGSRLGAPVPKQLLEIGGRTILQRTVDCFESCAIVDEIVAVLPPDLVADGRTYVRCSRKPLEVVAGGVRRQDSVANGFARVDHGADVVVVHDAARPFVTTSLIERTVEAATEAGAAVAALPARDTVKQGEAAGDSWTVATTLPRDTIFLAQTPQAFLRDVLEDAIALGRRGVDATDEAGLAERAGYPVRLVEGEPRNIKITNEDDVAFARGLVGEEAQRGEVRAGIGYDLHRLVEGRPLILGGIAIPFDRGLAGHSDADALAHAVTDAILGAAGAGDIGRHFSDSDPTWQGASSLDLLRRSFELARARGFVVENVDAVVIAERPKIAIYAEQMSAALAEALGTDPARVSVKGKSNEGLGELGRGEAIAVHAVALLKRAL